MCEILKALANDTNASNSAQSEKLQAKANDAQWQCCFGALSERQAMHVMVAARNIKSTSLHWLVNICALCEILKAQANDAKASECTGDGAVIVRTAESYKHKLTMHSRSAALASELKIIQSDQLTKCNAGQ